MTGTARTEGPRSRPPWWALVLCRSGIGCLVVGCLVSGCLVWATVAAIHLAHQPAASPDPTARTLRVLALGDSVTAGTHCSCAAFPEIYTREIRARTGGHVRLSNQGTPGATSADVLTYLESPDGAQSAQQSDIVLLTIGANDFADLAPSILGQTCGGADDLGCTRLSMTQLATRLASITRRLHDLRGDQRTTVLITGYWNVFEDGDVADADYTPQGRAASDRLTQQVNAVVERTADQGAATYVDLYRPFKGESGQRNPTSLLADDGDHPDAAGHLVIAEALVAAGPRGLAPPAH